MDLPVSEIILLAASLAVAGVVAGLLAGIFGIGGGAILVPVFYHLFSLLGISDDVGTHLAVGTSIAIILPTSIRSFLSHKKRGAVDMELLKAFVIAVPVGVILASYVFRSASGDQLRLIFAAIAILVGLRLVFGRDSWRLGDDLPALPFRWLTGTVIGFLSFLMGIGGGVLNNTFMTLFNRPIHQAVATSSGVGVLIAIPGIVRAIQTGWGQEGLPVFSTGYVNWIAVAIIIPVTLLMAPVGVRVAHSLNKRQLQVGFGLFMFFVAAQFVYSVYG